MIDDLSGPPDTRPPNKPPSNPPPPAPPKDLAADLDHAELLLRSVQLLADRLVGMDPALRLQLASGLRTARRAVAAAMAPARDGEVAVGGGRSRPDVARAGGPPALGAGSFSPPRPLGPPSFEIGIGPLYDALPRRP